MIKIIIQNEIDELKDIYLSLKNPPYPLSGMEIIFKDLTVIHLNGDSIIRIDGYDCYIDGKYFDLRKHTIQKITFIC